MKGARHGLPVPLLLKAGIQPFHCLTGTDAGREVVVDGNDGEGVTGGMSANIGVGFNKLHASTVHNQAGCHNGEIVSAALSKQLGLASGRQ
jgi:hypothetical protein